MQRPIRWGILGCGDVTEHKSGPAFRKVEGSALVAVMRRDAARAKDYAERHGVPRWYSDAGALIADPEVDAVYVATPPSSHAELAIACAQAGKPCYVEKPMARSSAEAAAMIEAFERAPHGPIPLFVAYYRRALPRFLAVRELLPELGAIRFVNVVQWRPMNEAERRGAWRVDPDVAGGGAFVDLASHALDLLDFFLGPITEVHGVAANQAAAYRAEDVLALSLRFASGVVGSGVWCFTAGTREDRVEIVGDRGQVTYATFDDAPIRVTTSAGTRELRVPHPEHIQQPMIERVVAALTTGTPARAPSTGVTAARTTWVMEAALRGYYASPRT